MAKKKRQKKTPPKTRLEEGTIELRVPPEVFKLAMEIYERDSEALRSILISVLGSDELFGINTVVLTSNEEAKPGDAAPLMYRKSC